MTSRILLGQTLQFDGNPFVDGIGVAQHRRSGAVVVEDGQIRSVGDRDAMLAAHPTAEKVDMGNHLLLPGFIDAHVHYPQTAMIASWGKRLIDWLNTYTFPEEAKFGDPDYAAEIARRYFDITLAHGTTTVCSFATIHPESVDAFFAEAQRRGLRALTGKTCMDRNARDDLQDSPQTAYDDSKALLDRWHGVDRLGYVITPRFSPTSTPGQLAALGALWAEHPDCLMQTHLSEQRDEIAWVADLYPEARDYLDTYEAHGLLGARGLYGHAIHLTGRERDRLAEMQAALVHCPTSNAFIGSGHFDMAGLAPALPVGLATDTGGGSSFSMLRTMAAAYDIGQLAAGLAMEHDAKAPRPPALHAAHLLWLATAGSARALHLDDRIGHLKPGYEADIIALDLASTPAIAQRAAQADDIWEAVFPTIMMGDDRAIAGVWVAGERV